MEKEKTIKGYGVPEEFELSDKNMKKQGECLGLKGFIKTYEIEQSSGGNIVGQFIGNSLEGLMGEFENGWLVVWSCGEYIDWAVFNKH